MRAALQELQILSRNQAFAAVILAALALGAGAWTALSLRPEAPPPLASGTLLSTPRPIADFTLVDHDNRPLARAALQGRWTLVFAGFTHCPDECPTTLGVMKAVHGKLGAGAPAMVFLSVDPERDTPEKLASYVKFFGPGITGATGTREALDALCASLGIAYVKIPGATPQDYTVDHTAALVLVDPEARVAGYFTPPLRVDTLAADLARVTGAS